MANDWINDEGGATPTLDQVLAAGDTTTQAVNANGVGVGVFGTFAGLFLYRIGNNAQIVSGQVGVAAFPLDIQGRPITFIDNGTGATLGGFDTSGKFYATGAATFGGPLGLPAYTAATLPSSPGGDSFYIYVSDTTGAGGLSGALCRWSGTGWRREWDGGNP